MSTTDQRPRLPAAVAGLLVLATLLTGCSALRSVAAPPGARPGVDVPREVTDAGTRPLGTPPLPPAGSGGYAFLLTHPDGEPVTFDPCRPIRYVVRPDHEPPGGADLLRQALADVTAATGLQFVPDGLTTEAPTAGRAAYQPERYGDRWAPVLIAWTASGAGELIGPTELGRAGPLTFGRPDGSQRHVSGIAVFNGPAIGAQLAGGEGEKARAVLLHELGHLVGLDHVTDPYQVMFDTNSYPLPNFRAGDRRGLELLGLGRCFDDY